MDLLSRDELQTLLEAQGGPCVSLFMPTHQAGAGTRENPIRYKNLLREAENRLTAAGLRAPEARKLLEPAVKLSDDARFWQRQGDGLAVFVAPGAFRRYCVPVEVPERVAVGRRFYVKPLLPLLTDDGRFYVLAISQKDVRLLRGTRHQVEEVPLPEVPRSLAEALKHDGPERQLQFHTGTPGAAGGRAAVFYGHGGAGEDAKDNLLRFFHLVDAGLRPVLRGERAPLVLACVDYLRPIYGKANSYPHLLEDGVRGNPDGGSIKDLHRQAWAVVEPYFAEPRREAAARYRALAGTGRTSADVREIVPAAHHGRVGVLFVARGREQWGRFDPARGTVRLDGEAGPEGEEAGGAEPGEELLNLAAVETLRTGGTVYAVPPREVPDGAPLAAVFRF